MLIRQTLLYLPAQFFAPLIQFATILTWAHILPVETVGIATLVVAVQDISFALFYMWWSHFVLRHLSRFRSGVQIEAFLRTEPAALAVSIVLQVAILTPALALYFSAQLNPALLGVMLAYLVSRSLNLYLAERARADVKIVLYTVMQVGAPAVGLAAGFAFIHIIGPTTVAVLAGFAVAQTASLLVALLDSDIARCRPAPDREILRQGLTFGIPMMAASLLSVIALNAPRFIVDQSLGLAAAGVFAVSYGLGLRVSSFSSMLVTAGAYPLVVRKFEAEGSVAAYEQLQRNTLLLAAVIMPAALGLIAVNPSVVTILLPADFGPAARTILPMAAFCGLMRDLRSHTTNQVFLLHAKPQYSSIISLVDLVLAVVLSFAGLALRGLEGAVVGPLVAAILALVTSISLAVFRFGYRVPGGGMLRIALAAIIMAVIVWFLPDTDNIIILAAEVALGGALYAMLLSLLLPMVREAVIGQFNKLSRRSLPVK